MHLLLIICKTRCRELDAELANGSAGTQEQGIRSLQPN